MRTSGYEHFERIVWQHEPAVSALGETPNDSATRPDRQARGHPCITSSPLRGYGSPVGVANCPRYSV